MIETEPVTKTRAKPGFEPEYGKVFIVTIVSITYQSVVTFARSNLTWKKLFYLGHRRKYDSHQSSIV